MPNSIALVKTGQAGIANRIIGSGTTPQYIAIGTGATLGATASKSTTALVTEVETRDTGTASRITTTDSNDTVRVVGGTGITATASRSITEIGLFDQLALGGNMYVHCILGTGAGITLASGDTLTVTVTMQAIGNVVSV